VSSLATQLIAPATSEGKAAVAEFQRDIAASADAAKAGDADHAAALLFDAVDGEAGAFQKASRERQQRFLDNARTLAPMFAGAPAAKPVPCEQWGTLKVPVLVMRGEHTRANFRLGDDMLASCLPPGTATAVVPKSSHMWYPMNPVPGANAILEFIAQH